jgi:cytochrome c6
VETIMLTLILSLVACGTEGETTKEDEILALTGDAAAGATIYSSNCAGCHGDDGAGVSAPSLQGWSDDAEFLEYVLYGDGDMPAFESSLSSQDIADVLAHVKTL